MRTMHELTEDYLQVLEMACDSEIPPEAIADLSLIHISEPTRRP